MGRRDVPFVPDTTFKCVRCNKFIINEYNFGKWSTEGRTIPKSPVCRKCCKKEEKQKRRLKRARRLEVRDRAVEFLFGKY